MLFCVGSVPDTSESGPGRNDGCFSMLGAWGTHIWGYEATISVWYWHTSILIRCYEAMRLCFWIPLELLNSLRILAWILMPLPTKTKCSWIPGTADSDCSDQDLALLIFFPIAAAASVENVSPFARKGNMFEIFRWMELEEDSYPQLHDRLLTPTETSYVWLNVILTLHHVRPAWYNRFPSLLQVELNLLNLGRVLSIFLQLRSVFFLVDLPFIPYIWYVRGWPIFIGWSS